MDNTSKASASNSGAIIISKNSLCIFSAVAKSTFLFKAITPPKIEIESASYALSHANSILSAWPIPQGFICFKATTVGVSNSLTALIAASASRILLNESFLPFNCLACVIEYALGIASS